MNLLPRAGSCHLLNITLKNIIFDDFDKHLLLGLIYKNTVYSAPFLISGDILHYRSDLLKKHGLKVPRTLEQLKNAVKRVHSPPDIYDWVGREQRGAGMNVWRWAAYFKAFGGQWEKDGRLIFNSASGVKATQFCLDLHKYAPPGDPSMKDYFYVVETFRGGKAAFMLDAFNLMTFIDKSDDVKGRWQIAPIPEELPSAIYLDSFAISAAGTRSERLRRAAGEFIGWATSKEVQVEIMRAGNIDYISRESVRKHPAYINYFSKEYREAITAVRGNSQLTIWMHPLWHQVGDHFGLILEDLYSAKRSDIQKALDDAVSYGNRVLAEYQRQK